MVGLTRVTAIAILFLVCKRILLAGGQGVAVLSFASSEMVVKDGITEIPVTILRKGSSEGTASFMLQVCIDKTDRWTDTQTDRQYFYCLQIFCCILLSVYIP